MWDAYVGFGNQDRSALSVDRRRIYAILDLRQEVGSGGFDSYFRYWGGDTARDALAGLPRSLGPDWALLLNEAMELFGPTYPLDADERARFIDTTDMDDALNVLDERLYELEARDDADGRLQKFLGMSLRPESIDKTQIGVPLTLGEDVKRVISGRQPVVGLDGRPPVQPWAVGPGRTVAVIAGAVGVIMVFLFPPLGIGLGLLGFILANTAWGHLRRGDRARSLTVFGQWLNGAVVLAATIAIVIWLINR